jgi:hypothetical protein
VVRGMVKVIANAFRRMAGSTNEIFMLLGKVARSYKIKKKRKRKMREAISGIHPRG